MTLQLAILFRLFLFQLTSSRRGWQCITLSESLIVYFNSHPHEEDDSFLSFGKSSSPISTHILTKRMTILFRLCHRHYTISTHILTKRMTARSVISYYGWIFQLTSSRRGWPLQCSMNGLTESFQLTSSRRGWLPPTFKHITISCNFNSHPHEEDDYNDTYTDKWKKDFNSHPHEEDDQFPQMIPRDWSISTHILTKRMTI